MVHLAYTVSNFTLPAKCDDPCRAAAAACPALRHLQGKVWSVLVLVIHVFCAVVFCGVLCCPVQVQAKAASSGPPRSHLAHLLVQALSSRQGSAARLQGLASLADALELNPEERSRLGLSSAASVGGLQGPLCSGEYGGVPGSAGAAAAAEHGYGYGAAADLTPPRDGGGAAGARGRRSVLGRVVGVLFGGGRREEGEHGEFGCCCDVTSYASHKICQQAVIFFGVLSCM